MPKISELPLANKLKEEDYIPIVQDGITKKVKGTHFVTEEEYSLDAFSPTIVANDKAMYKFGEGDSVDFSDSTYDGAYKSAILKGQTVVNLARNFKYQIGCKYEWGGEEANSQRCCYNVESAKGDTKYLIKNSNESTQAYIRYYSNSSHLPLSETGWIGLPVIITTPTKTDKFAVSLRISDNNEEYTSPNQANKNLVVEYQDGMENWDIPYFEGMTSVKMPVLKTIGKNLFDVSSYVKGTLEKQFYSQNGDKLQINALDSRASTTYATYKVKKGETLTLSTNPKVPVRIFDVKSDIMYNSSTDGILTYTAKTDGEIGLKFIANEYPTLINVQLEKGSVATPYEPYKSNILTVNEEVELRKVGNVQDELNLLTGELTQRVGEVTIDGTNSDYNYLDDDPTQSVIKYRFEKEGLNVNAHAGNLHLQSFKSDVLPSQRSGWNTDSEGFLADTAGSQWLWVKIKKDKLDTVDVDGVLNWLKKNPVTVQYELDTPIIKTVDLSGVPFGYKGGHIIKSSAEGSLLPKFEYEVAISRGAQISQNTTTLIRHDEKISELLKKTAAVYINQKVKIANLLDEVGTQDKVQAVPLVDMTDSDMVLDNMGVEHEIEIVENPDSLLINLIYDLIELNDTFELLEKVEVLRRSGLIDKQNYEVIKVKLNGAFEGE